MSKAVLAFLPVIAFAGITLSAIAMTDAKSFRYQVYPCQYGLTYTQGNGRDKIDYLVFANSRGMVAVHTTVLGPALARNGAVPTMWDYGKSWRGPEIFYTFLRDFLERKSASIVLVEFNLAKSLYVRYHERTPVLLTFGDLLSLLWHDGRNTWYWKLSRFLKWTAERVTRHVEDGLLGKTQDLDRKAAARTDWDLVDCPHSPQWVNIEANLKRRESYPPNWQARSLAWDLDDKHEALNTHYYEQIADLARRHGSKAVFFHVPEYLEPELAPEFVAAASRRFGVPIITPPRALLDDLHKPRRYHDPTHFTTATSQRYSLWLASELRRLGVTALQ